MKRIVVSVSNDLVTDQRVSRVYRTLKELDYDILMIGRAKGAKQDLKEGDIKRMKLLFHKGFLFYAEFNIRLFFVLLFAKKDILYANDLDTLLPNYLVSRLQGKELIFDSHELFSEVPEIQHKKFVKWFWLRIERSIIPRLKKIITVSDSIKKHYEDLYNVPVVVIRNVPKMEKHIKKSQLPSTKGKNVILYQGSVNVGRGLELMIETIKLLQDCVLVIVGSGDILEDLEQMVLKEGLEDKVKFTGRMTPSKLRGFTPSATIGISLEEDLGLNYRYALPNKLFDYIHAEVPVIVSDLPEMKKIVLEYEVGQVLLKRTPENLAKTIEDTLSKDYSSGIQRAKKELTWEKEKERLIALLDS